MTIIVPIGPEIAQDVLTKNLERAQDIANAGAGSATTQDRFVFVASFDGTNNDQDKNLLPGEQSTNVWQLHQQITESDTQKARYFPGPGTSAALRHSSWLPSAVTEQVIITANNAYARFQIEAANWAKANPGKEVSVMLNAFSRGAASAAIFSQMLYERGLVDPADSSNVLVAPGQIKVAGGVIFDPVTEGVDGNLAFAPNTKNVVVVKAINEYRNFFQFSDYSK